MALANDHTFTLFKDKMKKIRDEQEEEEQEERKRKERQLKKIKEEKDDFNVVLFSFAQFLNNMIHMFLKLNNPDNSICVKLLKKMFNKNIFKTFFSKEDHQKSIFDANFFVTKEIEDFYRIILEENLKFINIKISIRIFDKYQTNFLYFELKENPV